MSVVTDGRTRDTRLWKTLSFQSIFLRWILAQLKIVEDADEPDRILSAMNRIRSKSRAPAGGCEGGGLLISLAIVGLSALLGEGG